MATVTELRDNGSTVTNVAIPIIEPLAAQEIFGGKLRRFGDHYNTSPNSHLYRFLVALCGEAGAGSLKKELLLPKLFQRLESAQFLNLDRLYGDALALPRLNAEVYSVDPENQILTQAQWDDVKAKDAAYRERCLIWMRAIFEGPTVEGLKLAGQAATGVECDVIEQYAWLHSLNSTRPAITSVSRADTGNGGAATLTYSHTVVSGNNRALFVWVTENNAGSTQVTGITYGGVALTRVDFEGAGSARQVELWRLIAPTVGTANVVVTYTASRVGASVALGMSGVHQTVPVGTAAHNGNIVPPIFESVTSNFDDLVMSGTYVTNGSFTLSGNNQTFIDAGQAGTGDYLVVGTHNGLGPSIRVGIDQTPTPAAQTWSSLGVAVKPASSPLMTNVGTTTSRNEFVIIPRTPSITEADRRRVARLVDHLKPGGTLHTIFLGNDLRTTRTVRATSSSSNRFYVKKLVTGRTDVTWPALNPNNGLWIVGGTQTEAPTFAFMDRQEMITYITIDSSSATSEHVGLFNGEQTQLFSNLARFSDPFLYFSSDRAAAKNIAPLNTQQGWVNTSASEAHDTIVSNLHYPIFYFTLNGLEPTADDTPDTFWSSVEKLAPESDSLTVDFANSRPVNFVTWEMTPKPFDLAIDYDDGLGNWVPVVDDGTNSYSLAMPYIPSAENPWAYFEYHFDQISTTRLRITFTRREDTWPLASSSPFPYSVDIRGLRVMNLVANKADFVTDTGTDILGNTYTTTISEYTPDLTTDGLPTYWHSQPNPTKNAVESLYFDLRISPHTGTMAFLDGLTMDELSDRSQQDIEVYYSDGQVVDEIFVDPVIPGANMKFYYSSDDYPVWDDKLWTPIPRDYICKKGYHPLPTPQMVKYFKIEFSNLTALPYQPVEYPRMPKVRYRQFPTWVTDYFANVYPAQTIPTSLTEIETINYEPLDLFQKVDDRMGQTFEEMRSELETDHTSEITTQIEELLSMQVDQAPQKAVEDEIRYNSVVMWQKDLLSQIDPTRALGRVATQPRAGIDDTGFNAELGLPAYTPPLQQSVADLTESAIDKMIPPMWFPMTCRHGYKVVEASIDSKIAFTVAIRSVVFYRRNYTLTNDEPVYIETLDDVAHVTSNDFTQNNFAYYIGN